MIGRSKLQDDAPFGGGLFQTNLIFRFIENDVTSEGNARVRAKYEKQATDTRTEAMSHPFALSAARGRCQLFSIARSGIGEILDQPKKLPFRADGNRKRISHSKGGRDGILAVSVIEEAAEDQRNGWDFLADATFLREVGREMGLAVEIWNFWQGETVAVS